MTYIQKRILENYKWLLVQEQTSTMSRKQILKQAIKMACAEIQNV